MNRNQLSLALIGALVVVSSIVAYVTLPDMSSKTTQKKEPPRLDALTHGRTVPRTLLPPATPDRATPLERYVPVASIVDLALLYDALTDTPVKDEDYDRFAGTLSYECRATADAFVKHQRLEQFKAEMQGKLEAYKNTRYFSVVQPFYLDHLDLTAQAFPLIPAPGAGINWLYNGRIGCSLVLTTYALSLTNDRNFARYPVHDQQTAQTIESRTAPQRVGKGQVFLFVQDVDPISHTIRAVIVKVRLYDYAAQILGEL